MTRPEDALELARRAAAARSRPPGVDDPGFRVEATDEVDAAQLLEWAVLDPDDSSVRSTRRYGAPITWGKRGLLRLLRQYHARLTADQTRLNLWLVTRNLALEERVRELEAERERRGPS